jgi:hypothetical protein
MATPVSREALTRPARALIGWMAEAEALQQLNGRQMGVVPTAEQVERVRAAQSAVAQRPEGPNQSAALTTLPAELVEWEREVQAALPERFAAGSHLAWADLRVLVAMQPVVNVDPANERVNQVRPDDLVGIARIAVPVTGRRDLRAQFDQARNALMISSPNPNLRITSIVAAPAPNNQPGTLLGMVVDIIPSQMNAVEFRGRVILRDGYHRAFGLLSAGITHVPILVQSVQRTEDVVLQGMLPQDAYLGSRPPTLTDYSDDTVAADVATPVVQKLVIVQGIELTPMG